MQLVYQEKWVPMQRPKTTFQSDFTLPLDILLKEWDIASDKCPHWT